MSGFFLIDCVSKDDRLNPYERIQRIGGPNMPDVPTPDASKFLVGLRRRGFVTSERTRWSLPLVDAIQGILDGEWDFYIYFGAHQEIVSVEVARLPKVALVGLPSVITRVLLTTSNLASSIRFPLIVPEVCPAGMTSGLAVTPL